MSLIAELMGIPDAPRETGALPPFRPGEENDRWNAARLIAEFGADMIFVGGKGWGIWDGARYDFSDGPLRAMLVADRLQGLVAADARAAWSEEPPELDIRRRLQAELEKPRPEFTTPEAALQALRTEKALALKRHAVKCGNVDKMEKALRLMTARLRVPLEALDADPWSFTCPNGRIDLHRVAEADLWALEPEERSAERATWLRPHDRAARPTKCAGVAFDPAADCPEWRAFIELVLPDPNVRDCFHRSMGAMVFGRNEPQVAFLFRGSGGNGKSTAVNAIAGVLGMSGGYAVPCKIEMFLVTGTERAGQATPEEVDLPGARALIASEPDPTDELAAKKIKSLTGGDPRPARALNMPQFFYRPTGFPILSFNRTPRIKNEDEGTRRRLIFFPFEVSLRELPPEKRRSPVAVEKALAAEGPGILNWLLDGYREFRHRTDAGIGTPPGIDPPAAMLDLKDAILEHADPVGSFIADCCDKGPGLEIRTSQFYRVLEQWADMTGSVLHGKQTVTRIMQEKGFGKRKTGGGIIHWSGLGWQKTDNVAALLETCGYGPPSAPRG